MIYVSTPWPIVDATHWRMAGLEQQGIHEHRWWSPTESRDNPPWLFKATRQQKRSDRALPEHVVEKLAAEIAGLIGVPAAHVDIGERGGIRGALVESVRPSQWDLYPGQVLMPDVVTDYVPRAPGARGHSPLNIRAALTDLAPPPGAKLPGTFDAFDTFAGYLCFDALIAHMDRHDRNWAALRPPPQNPASDALCASFDHASSLGHTLTTSEMRTMLGERAVRAWAARGRARHFDRSGKSAKATLVDIAGQAAKLCSPIARAHWRDRLESLTSTAVKASTAAAIEIDDISRDFVTDLILINKSRLLDALT